MLKVEHMTIGYGDRILAKDISFELTKGECVLLAGPNGTGKTTLLKKLAVIPRKTLVVIPRKTLVVIPSEAKESVLKLS